MSPSSSAVYASTAAHTGLSVFAITMITDTVFTTLTGAADATGLTFPAGMTIFGNFTAVTLTSGSVIAYSK